MTWKLTVIRGNRSDGSYGDRVELTCPDCGNVITRDVHDCTQCGPAVNCDTLDGEILCPECQHLIFFQHDDFAGHCTDPHETDCPE
jgi:DNA-directed RNA polymerase subunit RPC12/RpoP